MACSRSQLHRAWKDAQAKVRVGRHSVRVAREALAEAERDHALALGAEAYQADALAAHDSDSLKPHHEEE